MDVIRTLLFKILPPSKEPASVLDDDFPASQGFGILRLS